MKKSWIIKINNKLFLVGGIGLILGVILILGLRFFTYQPEKSVHYHANFAIYLNGQREQFKDIFYYIDVSGNCTTQNQKITPHGRAHLHDSVNDVVHVEDEAVTWGHFFQNIGWVIDPNVVRTPNQVLLTDSQNKVTFMLNGKQIDSVINRVIVDKDKLLIDYGSTDAPTLQTEYMSIASTASKYNGSKDTGSCGSASHNENSWKDRMKHMF